MSGSNGSSSAIATALAIVVIAAIVIGAVYAFHNSMGNDTSSAVTNSPSPANPTASSPHNTEAR